jgi:hypothetical protein
MPIHTTLFKNSSSSRALEMFAETLLVRANEVTTKRGARTLTPSHLKFCIESEARFYTAENCILGFNVADPDPWDPYVSEPPGSGPGSFYHQAKIVRKILILTVL